MHNNKKALLINFSILNKQFQFVQQRCAEKHLPFDSLTISMFYDVLKCKYPYVPLHT